MNLLPDVESLAARIPDGVTLAVVKNRSGVAMAATRALLRRGVKELRLIGVPTSGLQADLLIGAGAVRAIEAAGVTLDEFGQAPCFGRAIRRGALELADSTCPAVYAALQAAEKGIPFMPLRGLIGSDIQRFRADWKVIQNPLADGPDPIVLLPAIAPDIALFHAPLADRDGNVWIGNQRECMLMAHAAGQTFVTVERVVDEPLLLDDKLAPATIPSIYVSGVAAAERGAWPLSLPGAYEEDGEHLALYARMAASEEGFARYLAEFVLHARAAAE
jgi:glutaconate CoA-transferase, subunit A